MGIDRTLKARSPCDFDGVVVASAIEDDDLVGKPDGFQTVLQLGRLVAGNDNGRKSHVGPEPVPSRG